MPGVQERFAERYAEAFAVFLHAGDERALEAAYELGRTAVAEELSLMELAEAHHRALGTMAMGADPREFAESAAAFFRESLGTFEIAARSYREAQETVRLQEAYATRQRALADAAVDINATLDFERILALTAKSALELLDAAGAEATASLGSRTTPLVARVGTLEGAQMTVPLCGRDARRLGELRVCAFRTQSADADRSVLAQLARMAAAAIENAERYQRERQIAHTLQSGLLPPSLPDVPGMEVAAVYRATGDGIHVGGDFYDLFKTGSGDWAVVIGDVCGKGPSAASLTALARYTVRAAALHETRPSAVLNLLNAAMIDQRTDGRFATVLCAYLAPRGTGAVAVTCASGGHPLPLVRRADGRVETLGATGTLLGVVADPALPDSKGELEAGDLLLLYTDGVIEVRRGRREIFGASDLVALLERLPDLPPQALLDRISVEVLEQAGGVLRDDVALLALQVRG